MAVKVAVRVAVSVAASLGPASVLYAADINSGPLVPALDRWMYPYNQAMPLGSEAEAPVFAPFGNPANGQFDDRDGEMLLGFDTSATVTPGQGVGAYRVISATLTTVVSPQSSFAYDPTPDSWQTYSQTSGPAPIADADAGRSIEVYLPGYRNGWTRSTFLENTRFTGAAGSPPNPFPSPARGIRNVFPAQYDPAGSGTIKDVSNNVDDQFDPRPLAVGATNLAPGMIVPVDTRFTFAFDMTNPDTRKYLRESLNAGRVNLVVSSLAEALQQQPQTVRFYCREAGIPETAATLTVRVCMGPPTDWDCSGTVDVADLFKYLDEWFALGDADFDEDGSVSVVDLFDYLDAWFSVI